MVFGTFDIFHPGHRSYFRQAKKLGDYLIVVVARDKVVKIARNQDAKNRERERARIIEKSKLAGKVVLGNLKNRYLVIKRYRPEVIALGYDQRVNLKELKNKLKSFNLKAKIVRLKSFKPEKYKSSVIKKGGRKNAERNSRKDKQRTGRNKSR